MTLLHIAAALLRVRLFSVTAGMLAAPTPPMIRLLDRDGVINEVIYHHDIGVIDSPFTPEQFGLEDGVAQAIRDINGGGFFSYRRH